MRRVPERHGGKELTRTASVSHVSGTHRTPRKKCPSRMAGNTGQAEKSSQWHSTGALTGPALSLSSTLDSGVATTSALTVSLLSNSEPRPSYPMPGTMVRATHTASVWEALGRS